MNELLIQYKAGNSNDSIVKSIKKYAYVIQGKGFINGQTYHNYQEALSYSDSALFVWQTISDTLNEANVFKFKGLTLGYLKQYESGKYFIFKALQLFASKSFYSGVAVSQYDLSRVYFMEGKLDSALLAAEESLDYWKQKSDTFRILTSENQMLNIFTKSGNFTEAKKLQENSLGFCENKNIGYLASLDFYFLSRRLYLALGDKKEADIYIEKYEKIVKNEMEEMSITVRSTYE